MLKGRFSKHNWDESIIDDGYLTLLLIFISRDDWNDEKKSKELTKVKKTKKKHIIGKL